MPESSPLVEPLDSYLVEVVKTLQDAIAQGVRRLEDNPAVTERSIQDCAEILDSVMDGNVDEWLA